MTSSGKRACRIGNAVYAALTENIEVTDSVDIREDE